MFGKVFLGNVPDRILEWIRSHGGQAARRETRVWWSADPADYGDYLVEGELRADSLDRYGVSLSDAVRVETGSAVTGLGDESLLGWDSVEIQALDLREGE